MTPAEHLARAETLLQLSTESADDGFPDSERNLILRALTHSVTALALELGVPPTPSAAGGDTDAPGRVGLDHR